MKRNRKARRRAKQLARADQGQLDGGLAQESPAAATPPALAPRDDGARIAVYAMCATFAVFAYLSLVNLDWALFWDDEATMAYLARNWLELGAPLVDDGRNVYTFRYGGDIAADGSFIYPQLTVVLYALAFALFGYGEVPVRALFALLSIAALALFALVLRAEFPRRPGLRAVAFVFACLAPVTLGYARSATYSSVLLFCHMLLFWSYLQFCARRKIGYAALALAAALAGFHAHYVSNLVFVSALAAFHLLFRRDRFDRRAWGIFVCAGAVYAAQIAWYYFAEYAGAAYVNNPLTLGYLRYHLIEHLRLLNNNGIVFWSVLLWFAGWRGFALWRARRMAPRKRGKPESHAAPERASWSTLREDRVFQHLVFTGIGLLILMLVMVRFNTGVRFITSFAPFGAPLAAAAVCGAWRLLKPAGAALAGLLLLTNIAAWPFLKTYEHGDGTSLHTNKPGWTLPYLAVEYHRDYRDSLREALEYLDEHAKQDDVVYFNYVNPSWLLWYFSDRLLVCCRLSRDVQTPAIDARGREYLFRQDVNLGAPDPDWLLLFAKHRARQSVIHFRDGGPAYHAAGNFLDWHSNSPKQRPEPRWHVSFPNQTRRGGATAIRFYRLAQ